MHATDRPTDTNGWMRWVEAHIAELDRRIRGSGAQVAAANEVVTTDGSGVGTFTFGQTYRTAPVVVATGGNGEQVAIATVTTTGFTAVFTDGAGSPLTGIGVRCLWQATPATK